MRFQGLAAFGLVIVSAAAQAQGGDYVGTWNIDLGATASYGVTYSRVDDTTVQRTGTTTVGSGAKGMGTLQIKPDGTYELRYWEYQTIYRTPVVRGTWGAVPQSENAYFHGVGAIALEGAKPDPKYPAAERKWYVFFTEDGSLEARYPPYDGFAKIRLSGGAGRPARPARRPVAAASPPAAAVAAQRPAAAPAAAASFTPDQVRRALEGKTAGEVAALLGQPVKVAYGTHYFNGVEKAFPPCSNGCNWKSFAIQFGNAGGTVSSVELQSWLAE